MTIGWLVLAAGRSRRFGSDKRYALFNNDRGILQATVESAVSTGYPVRVCLRIGEDRLTEKLLQLGVERIISCPGAEKGMGGSIADGVAQSHDWKGLLLVLGDMPFVKVGTYIMLAQSLRENQIAIPVYNGIRGNPVAFDRHFFPNLESLEGDMGARGIVDTSKSLVREIAVHDKGIHEDIDTEQELTRFLYRAN